MKIPRSLLGYGMALVVISPLSLPIAQANDVRSRVITIRVPNAAQVIQARSGADGAIHLLFDGEGGPFYVKSLDGGRTFSSPLAIVDAAARKPGLKFSAWDLAVAKDGRVHVAMGNNAWKLKLPQEEWSLYYASLAPGAQ